MRKMLTAGLAALTFGAAAATAAIPATADARPFHGGYHGHYHHGNGGAAIAAGIAGLAIGAALADNHRGYDYGYGYGYPAYGYGYGYRTCISRHWVWDPYLGRRVLVHERYAC